MKFRINFSESRSYSTGKIQKTYFVEGLYWTGWWKISSWFETKELAENYIENRINEK